MGARPARFGARWPTVRTGPYVNGEWEHFTPLWPLAESAAALLRFSADLGELEPSPLRTEVEGVALATWRCLGCRDAGRVDVRLDGAGRAQMLEVNPLAGLQPGYSDLPNMAEMAGMRYTALIGEIVRSAWARVDAG